MGGFAFSKIYVGTLFLRLRIYELCLGGKGPTMSMSQGLQLDARANWFVYITFVGVPLCLLVPVLLKGELMMVAVPVLAAMCGWLWARGYRITFDGDLLTCRTLLQKRSTRIQDISLAYAETGKPGASDSKLRIILELVRPAYEPPIVIQLERFKKQDLDQLCGMLKARLADRAKLSPFCE